MWPFLKAELAYTKHAWMFCYGLCALLFGGAALYYEWSLHNYMMNTSIAYLITMAAVGIEADEEKRPRYAALLPIPPRRLALLDLAYIALFQLGLVVLWVALLAFKPGSATAASFWSMVSQSALALSFITLTLVHGHLAFVGAGRWRRVNYLFLVLLGFSIAALAYAGWIGVVFRRLSRHYASASGALATTLLWLGLSWLSVALYVRRRSYLA